MHLMWHVRRITAFFFARRFLINFDACSWANRDGPHADRPAFDLVKVNQIWLVIVSQVKSSHFDLMTLPFQSWLSNTALYPQLLLKWRPNDPHDKHSRITDFGVKVKRSTEIMDLLPPEKSILKNQQVLLAFHRLFYQAKDQANLKAAIKNNLAFKGDRIGWILIVGPYWTKQTFAPFTEAKVERHDRRLGNVFCESGSDPDSRKTLHIMMPITGHPIISESSVHP